MKKRIYLKPETAIVDVAFKDELMDSIVVGASGTEHPLAPPRNDFDSDYESDAAPTSHRNLWSEDEEN